MQVERNVGPVRFVAVGEGALKALDDEGRGSSNFLFDFLVPYLGPLFFGFLHKRVKYLKFVDLLGEHFVGNGVLFDFGDHDLVDEVDFPELLIIAHFFVVLGVNYGEWQKY